jgi:hypothetical protein
MCNVRARTPPVEKCVRNTAANQDFLSHFNHCTWCLTSLTLSGTKIVLHAEPPYSISASVVERTCRNHLQDSCVITLIRWWRLIVFHLLRSISFYSFWILKKVARNCELSCIHHFHAQTLTLPTMSTSVERLSSVYMSVVYIHRMRQKNLTVVRTK